MEDFRFRSQVSPRTEAPMNSLVSPPRNGNRIPQAVSIDPRTTLPRRFTTDSGRVPTLSSLVSQRPVEQPGFPLTVNAEYKAQLLEKKRLEYENLRERKRRFEAEMEKLDLQQRRDELEMAHIEHELGRGLGITGHQSEPTTPPEYRDTSTGFPSMFSRPNRYSTSSLVSPPGLFNRPARSGSQLASPQSGIMQSSQSRFNFDGALPSRSVPQSRRNSDEDEKEEALRQDPTSHRSTNALNRYSMPVTRRGNPYDNIDQTNAAGFLFGDEDSAMEAEYAGLDHSGDDAFPKMISQKGNRLSTSSMALDLTSLGTEATNGWNKMTSLHRSQQSLSALNHNPAQLSSAESVASIQSNSSDASSIKPRSGYRHSVDMGLKQHGLDLSYFGKDGVPDTPTSMMSPPVSQIIATPPKLQTSFSANDIPTAKNTGSVASISANAHAQQHFHNHNASIGRIPPGAIAKRHSRELSNDGHVTAIPQSATFPSIGSALHANAPAFGPATSTSQTPSQTTQTSGSVSSPTSSVGYQSYFPNNNYNPASPSSAAYNMPLLMQNMSNMNLNGYSQQNYTGFAPMYQPNQPRDSQQRVIQQRRAQDNEAMSRYQNLPLENVGGRIFELCKDQHGCRYLQKQLENRIPDQIHMIWVETNQHVVELMMDPFGNYLCQKLLEYCTDEERTALIRNASDHMVRIALNQHGTRALQKMIEFVTIPEHVQIIIEALRYQVVDLIQDLNGNHVIQKCLTKLTSENNQFIFDAVGTHCVDVGTHRHGCCVLQRCIDHAAGEQKIWLIRQITENAPRLVQDPFGNYVVQYIIDLNEPSFTEPLVGKFGGKICALSRHKFSSNVIEKCLRCASDGARDKMVDELLTTGEMERLLRDSFGNYVVQTALEHSTYSTKNKLVEAIRPVLPSIRGTPYGRRLQAKVNAFDNRSGSNNSSGQTTPADPTQGQVSLRASNSNRGGNSGPIMNSMGFTNGRGQASYPASSTLTVAPPQPPRLNQVYTYPGTNGQPGNGDGQFF